MTQAEQVAARQIARINKYWEQRGHKVRCHAVPQSNDGQIYHSVRSDMKNGLPVKVNRRAM